MTKVQELEKMDELLRKKIIECLEDDKTNELGDLSVAVSYLAKNNVVADRITSTVEEDTKRRLKEAEERRSK